MSLVTRSRRRSRRGSGGSRGRASNRGRSAAGQARPQRTLSRASDDSVELMENDEPEIIVTHEEAGNVCIDLTEDTDDSIVDLTNVDTPVTLRQQPAPERRILSPRRRGRRTDLDTSMDDDEELPDLPPFVCQSTSPRREDAGPSLPNIASPAAKFTCPVCLDDDKQIRKNGFKLYSTICGHLFCETCIRSVLQTQKKCPTCRKSLSSRTVHPVYF